MSVKSKFVARIRAGHKAAELRRRAPRINPGCKVWIYTKAPEANVTVCATVDRVITGTPAEIWDAHKERLGVSSEEFQSYFSDSTVACAILFSSVVELRPVGLAEIRSESRQFQPPQFFKRLHEGSPELRLFRSRLARCE